MNLNRYLIIFINLVCISFPYNILGCADGIDPYDYFTSFYQNDLATGKNWQPFYYTNYRFLYDDQEPVDVADVTSSEWINYCGGSITKKQAYDFVCRYAYTDLSNLYYFLEKNQPLKIPDSVKSNKMTAYFMASKDLEALGYLMFAKQAEPYVTGNWNEWEPPLRDSLKMNRLLINGRKLFTAASKDFVKLRYAYQVLRLAHYSGRYDDCAAIYDEIIQPNPTQSILHDLAASLKAGAVFRTGQKAQAAYVFSRQFSKSNVKKIANYMSFVMSVNGMDESARKKCLSLCTNDEERADLLGLFALGSNEPEIETLRTISKIFPRASMLELLAVREINKIEDNYLSPTLSKQKGGAKLFYAWGDELARGSSVEWKKEAGELSLFFHTLAQSNSVKNPALFEVSAAYLAYVNANYPDAKKYLSAASALNLTGSLKDQWSMTNLLVTVSEKEKIDAAFEEQLLPSLKWLDTRAQREKAKTADSYPDNNQWAKFARNFYIEILAKRYHRQDEIAKEALCIGNAFPGSDYEVKQFVCNEIETKDLVALNDVLQSTQKTNWEKYISGRFPMKKNEVTDVIATTYIRDRDFTTALQWLGKINDATLLRLERNPFASLMEDNQDSTYAVDKGNFDKRSFLTEMKALADKEKQGSASAADLFKMASGFYNITYYGRAWEMVKYERSGVDGYYIPKDATPFEKDYYGCFTAESYFKKAMEVSADANFKARCLFMMAKCAQKQVQRPQFQDFPNKYEAFELAEKQYLPVFKNNKYFPQLVKDFGNTAFYKEARNTCSYLKDFVNKK